MKRFTSLFSLLLLGLCFPGVLAFSQSTLPSGSHSPTFTPVSGDIHDIRGIWVPNYEKYFWIALIVIGALVIIGLLVWWLLVYLKPRKPVRSLYEIIMGRLYDCRLLIQDGNTREFSNSVSDTVRDYLEQRFVVPITHQTTEEFIRLATQRANAELTPYVPQLKDFLSYCDMAKFARFEFDSLQMQMMLESAIHFVEVTKPQEKAAEPTQVIAGDTDKLAGQEAS